MNQTNTRRLLLTLIVLAALVLTACGSSQAPPTTFKIGIVNTVVALEPFIEVFKTEMTKQGYEDGKNVTYLYDKPTGASSNSPEQLSTQVEKLVQEQVDLIVTIGTSATQAAKDATEGTTLPIVFLPIADPVQSGFVKSLREPGGNLTGVADTPMREGKRLEYLLEIVPDVKRIYVPYDAVDTRAELYLKIINETAGKLGIELVIQPVKSTDEALAAVNTIPENVQAIFTLPGGPLISNQGKDLIATSIQKKLPLAVNVPAQVDQGALFCYIFSDDDMGEQVARMVVAILKGAKPADTPVESANIFLTINLKTAQTIGLTVSDRILLQARTIIR